MRRWIVSAILCPTPCAQIAAAHGDSVDVYCVDRVVLMRWCNSVQYSCRSRFLPRLHLHVHVWHTL
jgi:hypothetical protein